MILNPRLAKVRTHKRAKIDTKVTKVYKPTGFQKLKNYQMNVLYIIKL